MNNFVKIAIGILVVGLVIGIGVYFYMFRIGNKSYESIQIDKVTIGSSEVVIKGIFSDKSSAFKDFSYSLVGSELYVVITNVKLSDKYNSGEFEISIPVNGNSIDNIYLSDDKNTKSIYSK